MKKIVLLFSTLLILMSCKKDEDVTLTNPTNISIFKPHGLDVDWDQSGSNRIAYSTKESDTYYDIHLSRRDGTHDTCLTCAHPALPNKHIASPYWHPSGQWLLMTVEEGSHTGTSTDALPGFGAFSDIWIMNSTGTKAYILVDIMSDTDHGVISPRFSHDGKQIVWTDRKTHPDASNTMQQAGFWTIKLADFRFRPSDSIPEVTNIRTIEPVSNTYYECYGFSPDDKRLIFCSNMNMPLFADKHIYTMDTLGGSLQQLTQVDYNQRAFYKQDGSKIVWMTNTNCPIGGADWWMMNTDGTGKERLTYFNDANSSQYSGYPVWGGLGSFSSTGQFFVGSRQPSLITQEGELLIIQMP